MTNYGYPGLAKQHTDAALAGPTTAQLVQTPQGRRARSYPLGTVKLRPDLVSSADAERT